MLGSYVLSFFFKMYASSREGIVNDVGESSKHRSKTDRLVKEWNLIHEEEVALDDLHSSCLIIRGKANVSRNI